jgi:hypothetical protein
MTDQPKFSLLAATRHIGWGGMGKLRLSLPYVHMTDTDIPALAKMAHHCAQKHPVELLPLTSPCRNWICRDG